MYLHWLSISIGLAKNEKLSNWSIKSRSYTSTEKHEVQSAMRLGIVTANLFLFFVYLSQFSKERQKSAEDHIDREKILMANSRLANLLRKGRSLSDAATRPISSTNSWRINYLTGTPSSSSSDQSPAEPMVVIDASQPSFAISPSWKNNIVDHFLMNKTQFNLPLLTGKLLYSAVDWVLVFEFFSLQDYIQ